MSSNGPLSLAQATHHLISAMESGQEVAIIAVIDSPDQAMVGARILLLGEDLIGSLEDPAADEGAGALARAGLSGDPEAGTGLHTLSLGGGREATVYLELHRPPSEMVIVGAGHLARPLCTLGDLLGLEVTVLDDRPDFATRDRFPEAREVKRIDFSQPFQNVNLHPWTHVILVTRGHRFDYECLRHVLESEPLPGYVGMIGSRRRVRATFEALLEEGIPRERLEGVRAPIGLDIGAETPAEIAVCVAAEIVEGWHGGSCRPMREVERVLERLSS